MSELLSEYVLLTLACGAGTYLWRGLGVAVSSRIRPDSELFAWVGCVAFAMIAGLISRILFLPSGALEVTSLWQRLLGAMAALAVYYLISRRNLFAGVLAGGAAMYALLLLQR
jgi:branched-subunit amino acid transport protein